MKRRLLFAAAVCLFFVLNAAFAQQPALFDYDSTKSLAFEEKSSARNGAAIIREIVYASPQGGMVTATFVEPQRRKTEKLAAVIYLHGAGATRAQFLPEALRLAKSGKFAALLIDLPSARPAPWKKSEYDYLEADRDMRVQTAVDVRRGIDWLETLPQIDKDRIALVGYSYGATVGGILAGIEKRFKCFVLAAGGASQIAFWLDEKNPQAVELKKILKEDGFNRFVASLKPVEQIKYIKNSTAPIFFQFAKRDEFTAKDLMRKFYNTANEPKKVKWYDAAHDLNARATADRLKWLQNNLQQTAKISSPSRLKI